MRNGKPIFRNENVLYQREEKEGYWTFIPKHHPETRELIINRTGKEILRLCDGSNTLDDIERTMRSRYPQVKGEVILNDVKKMVAGFSRLGIVEWEGENPFLYMKQEPLADSFVMQIAQESDHGLIYKFLEDRDQSHGDDYSFHKSPLIVPGEYGEVGLRQKLFSFVEDFFLLMKDQTIQGLISISMPILPNESAAMIKQIRCPKKFSKEFLTYCLDSLLYLAVRPIAKVKLCELKNEKMDAELEKILEKLGFRLEGEFQSELGVDGDIRVLSWFYKPELLAHIEKVRKNAFVAIGRE